MNELRGQLAHAIEARSAQQRKVAEIEAEIEKVSVKERTIVINLAALEREEFSARRIRAEAMKTLIESDGLAGTDSNHGLEKVREVRLRVQDDHTAVRDVLAALQQNLTTARAEYGKTRDAVQLAVFKVMEGHGVYLTNRLIALNEEQRIIRARLEAFAKNCLYEFDSTRKRVHIAMPVDLDTALNSRPVFLQAHLAPEYLADAAWRSLRTALTDDATAEYREPKSVTIPTWGPRPVETPSHTVESA